MTVENSKNSIAPFNSPIEIGLRSLTILNESYPRGYSMQRLVILDYLLVHSDDIVDGPVGLHPKTPHRGGEILVRRDAIRNGIRLYESRGLIEIQYGTTGIYYYATEKSAIFLDSLMSEYIRDMRMRSTWLLDRFQSFSDEDLDQLVAENLGEWGAEFAMESILWENDIE